MAQTESKTRARAETDALIEPGSAYLRLRDSAPRHDVECFDVIVIGAGQAGLSVGYYLARSGLRFTILDAHARVGDSWRKRWDSLRLFSPAHLDGLAGMRFPAPAGTFPTKDQMADYLEAYAERFQLPVQMNTRVERVEKRDGRYFVHAAGRTLQADHVVVAMASYQRPKVPAFAAELDASILQLHSSAYQNPSQLKPGGVLLVGVGNSGAEIALELSRAHRVWISGCETGQVPVRIGSFFGRYVFIRFLMRVIFHRVLTMSTPMGRKARPRLIGQGTPLIRTRTPELQAAGVERIARVTGVREGRLQLEHGEAPEITNVIWSTGYHPGFSFVELPVFGDDGEPRHERGVVTGESGLYFVGLHFLYAMSSSMIHGVGRDADHIVKVIAERAKKNALSASRESHAALAVQNAR